MCVPLLVSPAAEINLSIRRRILMTDWPLDFKAGPGGSSTKNEPEGFVGPAGSSRNPCLGNAVNAPGETA